jgi:hypothetical protein
LDLECGRYYLKVFFASENSNKSPKTKFWKEKSIEDVVKLGPMAHATIVWMKGSCRKDEK